MKLSLESLVVTLADSLTALEVKLLFSYLVCQVQFGKLVFSLFKAGFKGRKLSVTLEELFL